MTTTLMSKFTPIANSLYRPGATQNPVAGRCREVALNPDDEADIKLFYVIVRQAPRVPPL
jgi:hypothetical protein